MSEMDYAAKSEMRSLLHKINDSQTDRMRRLLGGAMLTLSEADDLMQKQVEKLLDVSDRSSDEKREAARDYASRAARMLEIAKGHEVGENAEIAPDNKPCHGFGWALLTLKSGGRVARGGWNGKGIYIEMQTPDEHSKMTLPYIYIVTNSLERDNPLAPRGVVPWLASQTDLLASDWRVV